MLTTLRRQAATGLRVLLSCSPCSAGSSTRSPSGASRGSRACPGPPRARSSAPPTARAVGLVADRDRPGRRRPGRRPLVPHPALGVVARTSSAPPTRRPPAGRTRAASPPSCSTPINAAPRSRSPQREGVDPGGGARRRGDRVGVRARPGHQPRLRRAAGRPGRPGDRPARRPRCAQLVADAPPTGACWGSSASRRSNVTELNLAVAAAAGRLSTPARTGPAGDRRTGDDQRGELRIYLGAAPGRGQDLRDAGRGPPPPRPRHRRRRRAGRDPRPGQDRRAARRPGGRARAGRSAPRTGLDEMDLDAVLARRPRSRWSTSSPTPTRPARAHPKRWQDVEELLDAGIDVISTVNVQHLESLNDVVERITGVRQQETVPDEVVRRAEQIELVDITPEALRRRMAHGNIYAAGQGRRRAGQLLPAGQPHRAARAGAAVGGRRGRRRPAALPHRPAHHARPGRPASGSSSR